MSDTTPNTSSQPIIATGHLNAYGRFTPDVVSIVRILVDPDAGDGVIVSTTIARTKAAIDEHDTVDFKLTDTIGDLLDRLASSPSAILRVLAGEHS